MRSATARSTSATGDRAGHSFRLPRTSLYKEGLDGATPSSCCIAYSNNHDIIVAKDTGTLRAIGLHVVDALALVHALSLRLQALVLLFPNPRVRRTLRRASSITGSVICLGSDCGRCAKGARTGLDEKSNPRRRSPSNITTECWWLKMTIRMHRPTFRTDGTGSGN